MGARPNGRRGGYGGVRRAQGPFLRPARTDYRMRRVMMIETGLLPPLSRNESRRGLRTSAISGDVGDRVVDCGELADVAQFTGGGIDIEAKDPAGRTRGGVG